MWRVCEPDADSPVRGLCVPSLTSTPGGLPRALRASTAPEGHLCLKPSVGRGCQELGWALLASKATSSG